MRVLISGSTGLIGTSLVAALKATAHTPVRLLRSQNRDDAESILWNPAAGEFPNEALENIDAVVHLAGASIAERRWSDAQKTRILDSRTTTTSLLAGAVAAAENPPAVFLSGSAIGFYGDRGNEELNEISSGGEGFLADVVRAWEHAASTARDSTRLAFLRTGVVLAADGGALKAQLPFFRLGIGGRIGDGRQWLSWISIQDMVQAIIWLLDNEVSGPVNMTAPNPVTNAEFTATLGQVLSRPTILPTPKAVMWATLGRELTEQLLYTSQKVEPAALIASGYRFREPDLAQALRSVLNKLQ
ncbi:MAG: TIGR01777 family oxidoreductase [Acidimicrobiaceae bacterium]|nr:TIGR01777 family oxidoreductase [Acidimicrobiaceae bacterium]MDE0606505.1 TIGR01777 family oxidoreductase [Acidimicrobiaceae bacterium]